MKEITLTKGKIAIVDDGIYEELKHQRWHYLSSGYACRDENIVESEGKPVKKVLMHRLILGVKKNEIVDHINGNKLDNRKENLRMATLSQNSINAKKISGCVSKFKGVSYMNSGKRKARWTMRIVKDGKVVRREYHVTEIEAALAYNKAIIELFGEYAKINKIS